MTDQYRPEFTEEEKQAWITKYFTGKPCIGCKAVQEAFRKLFFTKSS